MANKPIISVDSGKLQTIAAGDVGIVGGGLRVEENAFVGGDLQVEGDIISGGSQNVVIKDQFLDLGLGATATAQNTGFTFSVKEGSVATTFSAIFDATEPTPNRVTVASSAGFAVGDIIVVEGSDNAANDGLYYVASIVDATTIEIDTASQSNAPFLQTAFSGSTTGETGRLTQVDLAVMAISNGLLPQQGGGTISVGETASAYYANATVANFTTTGYSSMAASSLQTAYETGNTIVVDNAADGALQFDAAAAGVDTFSVGASTAFGIASIRANTATLEGAAAAPGSAKVNVLTGGTVQITENNANGLEIGAASVTLNGTTGTITRATNDLTLQGTGGANVRVETGDAFTVGNGTAVASIGMDSAGAVDINAGDTSSFVASGTAGTDISLQLGSQNAGAGNGLVEVIAQDIFKVSTGTLGSPAEQLSISATNSVFANQLQASATNGFQFGAGQNVTNITTDFAVSQLVTDLASASAIVTYVGSAIAGTALPGTTDAGAFSVLLDGADALGILGGGNISTAGAGTNATISLSAVVEVVTSLTVAGTTVITSFIDEDDMVSDSAAALPTQQSVKAYVDTRGNANYLTTLELETNATAIPAGSVVAINSSGNAVLADANAVGLTNVIGFALNATTGTGTESIEIAQFGALGSVPGTYSAGDELYLSTTAGAVTPTPPNSPGETIYRVGTAISGTQVAISLQFIAEVL